MMRRIFFSFFLLVLLILLIVNFIFSPIVDKMVDRYVSKQLQGYWRELTRGTFHMVMKDLERVPEALWDHHIDELRPQFGYPIDLKLPSEAGLSDEEQIRVMSGQILVKGDGETFLMRAGQSPYLFIMGPIKDPELNLFYVTILVWAALIILLALLTLVWVLPFYRKLQRISTAALAFGEGNFNTRARVPCRSALAPLAGAFNRMADRIQELIKVQRELTNAVSHELRTPIARIRFSLEMLSTATRIGDRSHYTAEISKDVDELDALVSESLTYARFDRGAPKMEWQSRAIETWLQKVAQAALRGHRNIYFSCASHLARPDQRVYLEPRYMGRAVGNLLQNAAKHAASRVKLVLEEREGQCCIHVDDDGQGIPVVDRERVFEPFTRLDGSRSRDSGGHGLGLAIVRRVIEWHGGKVHVSDAPLGGARLTLCWPGLSAPVPGEAENED
jgi:signal transduction histidine kinase